MSRIERNRALTRDDRLIQPESIPQDDRQVAVPVRPRGSSSRLLSISLTASSLRPFLMREHSRVVHRIGMVGRDLEDGSCRCCLPPPTGRSAGADRDRYRFVQAYNAVSCRRRLHGVLPPRPRWASLSFFLGLDVVLEEHPGIQRSIGLLRFVFQLDLGELQRDSSAVAAESPDPLGLTPVMMMSVILMIRYSCWPLPALRTVIVASLM
jgi:hypothetical protein